MGETHSQLMLRPPWGRHRAGAHGPAVAGGLQSETCLLANENNKTDPGSDTNHLQNAIFWVPARPVGRLPPGSSLGLSLGVPAKKSSRPPDANQPDDRGSIALAAAAASESRRSGGAIAGDYEEGRNSRSQQAFSGRLARIVLERVPVALNGPVPPLCGGAGSQGSNEFSACWSWEQRDTGPRTPLQVNEGRPRARYDKKESSKCSQVEVDSC
jgi:hypothetical protein